MVEQIIDVDGIKQGQYFIKPSFDTELEELKERMDAVEEKLNNELEIAAKDLKLESGTQLKLEYVSHHGYHFRIILSNESALRQNKKYTTLDTVKGGIRFTTTKLGELNLDFTEARTSYEEQQKSIVDEVIRVARKKPFPGTVTVFFSILLNWTLISVGYLGPLSCVNNQLAQLDCLLSFAVAAITAPIAYTRPKMFSEGNGILALKGLRHPCLELQEDVVYIPNDCNFKKGNVVVVALN